MTPNPLSPSHSHWPDPYHSIIAHYVAPHTVVPRLRGGRDGPLLLLLLRLHPQQGGVLLQRLQLQPPHRLLLVLSFCRKGTGPLGIVTLKVYSYNAGEKKQSLP